MTTVAVPPQRIHRYRILSELGQGAMGRVYLAEDPNIGRRLALKVLSSHGLVEADQEAELRERFLVEARAAGQLTHPGIVTVFDADTDPESGEPYLAMEWVDGENLAQILDSESSLPIARAVDLIAQVASALDYAHRHRVVHRDIKPANLLVTTDGEVKISDFGVAKLHSTAQVALTLPGRIVGSPYYMSPEQVQGEKVDGRTDQFALGVVLYECLTGELAFSGDSLANVTYKIVSVDPRPPEIYNPDIPDRLRKILDRMLQKRPEDRYETCGELERDLRAVISEIGDETRDSRAGTSRAKAVSSAELQGSTVLMASPGTTVPASPKRRSKRGLFVAGLLFLLLVAVAGRNLDRLIPGATDRWLRPFGLAPPATAAVLPPEDPGGAGAPLPVPLDLTAVEPPDPGSDGGEITAWIGPLGLPIVVRQPSELLVEEGGEEPGELAASNGPEEGEELAPPPTPEEPLAGEAGEAAVAPAEEPAEVPSEPATAPPPQSQLQPQVQPQVQPPPQPQPPPPPKPTPELATMEILYVNHLRAAYIGVWVDGRRKAYNRVEAPSFLKRRVGQEYRRIVEVPAGLRTIEVRISDVGKGKVETAETLRRSFKSDVFYRLHVEVEKGTLILRVEEP